MKLITTSFRKVYFRSIVIFILLVTLQSSLHAQSVPIYATTISSESNTDFSSFSKDGNLTTRARVRASSGIAVNIGAYSGHIELQFGQTLPANTTSFVKIQTDDNLLPSLLGGSLGGLLSNVLGSVLIGNQEFTVEAKNGNSVVLSGNSQTTSDFSTTRLRIVVNAANEYFVAITPSQPYNRIRLTNRVGSLLGLNNTKGLYVYDAYYIGTPDICGGASYTSFEGSGLNLDLLGLGGAGVTNPHYVLDSNPNNFSRLSLGILSVAAAIEQTVYFEGLSQPTDQFFIKLKVDPSLLALGVANNIQIEAASGSTVLQTVNLESLLNLDLLTLLQGEQVVTIPFKPNVAVNRITVRYNSLLNVQLTQSLDLYSVSRTPANPVITDPFTLAARVCSGSTASLIAQTGSGTELNWYSQATGGTLLATTASGVPFVTDPLTQNASFYVSAKRINCPEESPRVRINVNVVTLPKASDIIIPDNQQACNGAIVLSPSSSIGGVAFKYYKDQNKTQEITTGFAGDAGVTYTKNATNGELSISGLTAVNSPYTYYVSITVDGLCENPASTLKQLTVNYSSALSLTVLSSISGCGSVNLRNAIVDFNSSSDIQYNFFDSSNTPISAVAAASIETGGIYNIQAVSLSGSCSSVVKQVNVTVNPQPTLTITNANIVVNTGVPVTLQATSNASIIWYDSAGNALASNSAGPFSSPGFYTFTAVAGNGSCSLSRNVFVTVVDPSECPVLTERVYANSQSWSSVITGTVSNASQATDGNPQTFSTITTGIGLLGIGTTSQSFQWSQTITAGTAVTIKLGSQYSALIAAGAYSVIGTKRNSSGVPIDIGAVQSISGSLLNLLSGQNTFEYSFVPSTTTGPKAYDGIRIIVGSVASIAQNVNVYEAYYEKQVAQVSCGTDIEDVFYGVVDLGVGLTTATVGVSDATNAIDQDVNTFATVYSGAGVLAAAELTVAFRTPTLTTDSVEIILSRPSTILDLNLLSGFTVQLYLGNAAVGSPIVNTSVLLSLHLLNGGSEARLTLAPQSQPYDRITIRLGGVATVLNFLRVHDIKRIANTSVINGGSTNSVQVCQNDIVQLSVIAEDCANYIWYDASTGGNIVSTGTSFTVPATMAAGTYTYYIQPVRFGCPSYARGAVTIIVGQKAPPTAVTQININGTAVGTVCSATGDVTLSATLNSTLPITNPIFYWYSFDGTTMQLVTGQNTATLALTGLAAGSYTYYVGISSDEYCQTAEADRKAVSFTILPFSQPTDITADNVLICAGNNAVVTPTSSKPNPQFFWFLSNNNSQPIVNGAVINGITYTVAANGVLTVSGLTITNSPYTYYVGLSSDSSCLNQSGNFKPVTITVNDSGTPTTNDTTQDFCLSMNPTIGSIQINEPNVAFYDAVSGGTLLAATTALLNGATYYAGFDASTGCGSFTRLAITVAVNDTPTPTTNDTSQDFCLSSFPTIADIQVNETGIIYYSAATGSTPLDITSALVQGATYYASLKDAITGCESSERLAITVNLNDVTTPSTNDTTQDFCFLSNSTVADIQVNEANVVFYTQAVGGVVLSPVTPLANGTYYGSLSDGNGCSSLMRLAVTVTIVDPATPTTNDTTQEFCVSASPTVADIQVNEANVSFYTAATAGIALASTDALATGIYYAGLVDAIGCESSVRLLVNVTLTDPATPTTNDTTQDFCIAANATVANIQVNESNVVYYTAATGGTAFAATDTLVNGTTYYAAQVDANGCESSVRLAIVVTIIDTATPTTNDTTQDFCLSNSPTVADIQVNEAGVVFYTAATGGTLVSVTTSLVSGSSYYASLTGEAGCESTIRLAIAVTVTDPPTPTTNDATQYFCFVNTPTVADIQVNEANVSFYTAATGGTALAATNVLVTGSYYAGQTDGNGCESSVRLLIAVTVTDPATPTTNDTTQDFCIAANATVANIQVNEANVVYYTAATGGTAFAATDTLVNGTTYYAAQVDANGCESSVRLAIAVTIFDTAIPTTNDTTQDFCLSNSPTVADIQVNEAGVVFYTAATGGTLVSATTALVSGSSYYASLAGTTGCESTIRLAIAVTVTDPATPTTNDATQDFCFVNTPTVADIQVNEANVSFYTVATGGTALAATNVLVTGSYYAGQTDGNGCESSVRLLIAVTVTDPATPTTNDATQDFCIAANATVANIQVNEANVVYYTAATGGTAFAATDALVNGTTYYAAQVDANGCQSSVRLAITVAIIDTATPTTNDTTQDFCLVDHPTVANIQVNQTGVVFYNSAIGGTVLSSTAALVDGMSYYGSFEGTSNCPSVLRLQITVTVNDAATPTTNDTTQEFCQSSNPTLANIQMNQFNVMFYADPIGGTALVSSTPLVSGIYYAVLLDPNSGCQSSVRLPITVSVLTNGTPTINGGDGTACVFEEVTYTTLPGKTNYVWTVTNGTITSGGQSTDNAVTIEWSAIGEGTINVVYSDNCSPTNTASYTENVVTCSDITVSKTVDNPKPSIDDNVVFTITVNNMGMGGFIDVNVTDLLPSGYLFVSAVTTTGSYNSLSGIWMIPTLGANQSETLTMTVKVMSSGDYMNMVTVDSSIPIDINSFNNQSFASVDPLCLVVYNEFTPNGDGSNDTFKIDCIENYPTNRLEVYNRYGVLVFSKNHYNNDWDGSSNASGTLSQDDKLPSGTYYYILNMGIDDMVKKGWIYLVR